MRNTRAVGGMGLYRRNFPLFLPVILFVVSTAAAQTPPAAKPQAKPAPAAGTPAKSATASGTTTGAQDISKYPGLLAEFQRLFDKLQQNVKFPAARTQSHLLPLLPENTISYGAISNYGDAAQQALKIFQQELQESAVLRDWWAHRDPSATGPTPEQVINKFSEVQQYLGDEIVLAATAEAGKPKGLVVAEIKKPGLKPVLQQWIVQLSGKAKPTVRVLDVKELASAPEQPTEDSVILVRPDFLVAASDLATLRDFNSRLDKGTREFATTPLGQRITQEYEGGVTVLAAVDLQKAITQMPARTKEQQENLERTGFADMKYLVWDHADVGGQTISKTELSFNGPRHGVASWLAKPTTLGSLDFVSPKAMVAGTVVLTSPAGIFEDVKALYSTSKSNPFPMIAQVEQGLKVSLKDDLLRHLGGELTVELDSIGGPQAEWKAILKVDDAEHIQQTLTTLLGIGHLEVAKSEEGGVAYYHFRVPAGKSPMDINYAFVDGYWIVASSHDAVAEAVRLHASGGSLVKSQKFLTALPPGHTAQASALFYEDPASIAALRNKQLLPEMAGSLSELTRKLSPAIVSVYGEDSAIRAASSTGTFDVGSALVVGAIAIPNLLRSRIAANEPAAVGVLRSVNAAQRAYGETYPNRGFAAELATLGVDPPGSAKTSADHAGLLDESVANASCTSTTWCTKSGYQFRVTGICKLHLCTEYVVTATPVNNNTGTRNFCATSDGVIHYKLGMPLTTALTVAECKAWPRMQ